MGNRRRHTPACPNREELCVDSLQELERINAEGLREKETSNGRDFFIFPNSAFGGNLHGKEAADKAESQITPTLDSQRQV